MMLRDAWNKTEHGGKMARPEGLVIEKWIGEKPGLPPSFDRFVKKNLDSIAMEDLMAEDWDVVSS